MIEQLRKEKLPMPDGLLEFIYEETNYRTHPIKRSRYVDTLEIYNGKLLLRTFAYRNINKSTAFEDMEIQEVCRRLQDEKYIALSNIENKPLAGKVVEYDFCGEWDTKWNYLASSKTRHFGDYEMIDKQAWIDKLDIPYCQYFSEKNKSNMQFFDYVCAYLDQPKIELLVKADLSQFVHCYKKLNLKEKSLDKIFRINNYWIEYLKELSYSDIMLIKSKSWKIKTYEDLKLVKKYKNAVKDHDFINRYKSLKMLRYIEKNRVNYHDYNDYLRFCETLGYDLTRDLFLYPKNLHEKHDQYMTLINERENKDTLPKFMNVYKKNLKYVFSNGDLVIMPCENMEQLKFEGKELDHCVATYANSYMLGKTNIFFIRKINDVAKPYATLELRGKKVEQCRGYKNNVYESLDERVKCFVNTWCKKFKFKSCFS